MLRSAAQSDLHPVMFALKKLGGEFGDGARLKKFTTEYIQICRIDGIGEMPRNQRSFNQLSHAESDSPFVLSEINDIAFAESLHFYLLAQLGRKLLDILRVSNKVVVTIVNINRGGQPPGFAFLKPFFPGKRIQMGAIFEYRHQLFHAVVGNNAAVHQAGNHGTAGLETFAQGIHRCFEINPVAAGENIHCGIIVFRPE